MHQSTFSKSISTLLLVGILSLSNGFIITKNSATSSSLPASLPASSPASSLSSSILYSSSPEKSSSSSSFQKDQRWSSLSPTVKQRIIKEAHERAIRNKKKREPAADKKRRLLFQYKKAQMKARQAARVERPLPTASPDRIALKDLIVNEVYNGTVISLTDFGAYIDIGSECDGLLHVSQITRETFVEHPRQALVPGMQVDVRLVRVSPELKKMHLSMLPIEVLSQEYEDEDEKVKRVQLDDLSVDDELWGEIKRVTAFGAYVELGAVVTGWLHFMDHPLFGNVPGAKPDEFMEVGQRIRCWVSNIDYDLKRIKLTANRPQDLPGPRREIVKTIDDSEYY